MPHPDAGRFVTVPQVADALATSEVQVIAMLRRGDIRTLQLGGRRQWRSGRAELKACIQRCYAETEHAIREQARG